MWVTLWWPSWRFWSYPYIPRCKLFDDFGLTLAENLFFPPHLRAHFSLVRNQEKVQKVKGSIGLYNFMVSDNLKNFLFCSKMVDLFLGWASFYRSSCRLDIKSKKGRPPRKSEKGAVRCGRRAMQEYQSVPFGLLDRSTWETLRCHFFPEFGP